MIRRLRITSGFLLLLLFLNGCVKKEFDAFYARPDNLAPPIYQQLVNGSNFKSLLACIDKAGYKNILGNAGYWTFFAPNDAAFSKYFTEKGITGIEGIDSITAKKIITYSMVYNAFRKDQLSNYQSTLGILPNQAFKRKTVYYDFVETESGSGRKIIATNRNGVYYIGDNNNKNIPFFMDNVLAAKGMIPSDYTDFFPNATYSGFNVVDASVVNADLAAENGIIHEIDKVILPLQSLDQYVASNPNYSEFKNLLNKLAAYVPNSDLTHRYNVLTGSPDSVFIKIYSPLLGFSPNNENYLGGGTDSQINGYTLMVPTNAELLAYSKKILTYFQGSFDIAPPAVLTSFINSLMSPTVVWPSHFSSSTNVQSEIPTFSTANIIEKKLLSNGVFYGTNKVQDANVFRTVYSKPFLNPNYGMMLMLIDRELKYSMVNPNIKYTMFTMSDDNIKAAGYGYSTILGAWTYLLPGALATTTTSGSGPLDNLNRILQTSVLQPNIDLTDISGQGIVEGYNGEYIKYNNNTIMACGNIDAGNYLVKDSSQTVINGTVYYTHEVVPAGKLSTGGLLSFTSKSIGAHINDLALADPTNFGSFNSYMIKSALWASLTLSITGTSNGTFYTVFIPNNAAIVNAVKQGFLPGNVLTGVPNFAPTLSSDIDLVTKFIQYHILNKNTVVPDGVKSGGFATLLQNSTGDPTLITVFTNQKDVMVLRDMYNNSVNVVVSKSNNLSQRCVIHSIDNFLKYKY